MYGTPVYAKYYYIDWLVLSLSFFQFTFGEVVQLYMYYYTWLLGIWYYTSVPKFYQSHLNVIIRIALLVSMALLHLVDLGFEYQTLCQQEEVTRWEVDSTTVFSPWCDPWMGLKLLVESFDIGMGFFTPIFTARQSTSKYFFNEGT